MDIYGELVHLLLACVIDQILVLLMPFHVNGIGFARYLIVSVSCTEYKRKTHARAGGVRIFIGNQQDDVIGPYFVASPCAARMWLRNEM